MSEQPSGTPDDADGRREESGVYAAGLGSDALDLARVRRITLALDKPAGERVECTIGSIRLVAK